MSALYQLGRLLLPPPLASLPFLGSSPPEAGGDPRLLSLHRPLQVLLLHSKRLRHILPPQAVARLLPVLPPHAQLLQGVIVAGALGGGLPAADVEAGGRRVGIL